MKSCLYLAVLFVFSTSHSVFAQEGPASFQKKVSLALEAAKVGYLLPTVLTRLETGEYLAAFAKFTKATPAGYEIYGADADLHSGLKFVIYRPLQIDGEEPWILSLVGTEGLVDWINNSDLGRPQFVGLKKIVTLFTMNFTPDKELIITGHSLGGALAQAAAHEIQRERNARGLNRKRITLITWNGFGAQELVNKFGTYDPQLPRQMDIANYFVRGDVVSQIGHHMGPAYELVPSGLKADSKIATILELHSLELIVQILSGGGIVTAGAVIPPFAKSLNTLSRVSGVLSGLYGQAMYDFRQLWLTRWICNILEGIETPEQLRANLDAYTYLYNVGFTDQIQLRAEKHPDKVRDYVRLKKALERFLLLKSQ